MKEEDIIKRLMNKQLQSRSASPGKEEDDRKIIELYSPEVLARLQFVYSENGLMVAILSKCPRCGNEFETHSDILTEQ